MKKICLALLLIPLSFQLVSQTLTVITPNGGENWIIGCPNTIQWMNSSTPTSVKIELFKNNVFCLVICPQVPPGQNIFTWTPLNAVAPGNDYKVKVSSLTNTANFDFSNTNFSISPGVITVNSPNGGEQWQAGSTHPITWTDNICENVKIELWKNGVMNSVICPSTPSTGSFTWIIPNLASIPPAGDYKIRILSLASNSGTTTLVSDFSDNNFTILGGTGGGITVLTPNGGESWMIGCPNVITWIAPATTLPVKIELYRNGVFSSTICNPVPAGMVSFTWIPPVTLLPGNDYKVKVSSLTNTTMFDYSDANFSLFRGTITLTSPNGGETWVKGTNHPVTWNDNLCENVRIELWKGSAFNLLIAASVPSSGSFNWLIPNVNTLVPGNDYKVKILSTLNTSGTTGLVYDLSDNYFSIMAGSNSGITVIAPNGGENWIMGCTNQIQWISAATLPVKIELYKNNNFCMTVCAQVPAGMNSFTWVLPYTLSPGNDYRIKVSSVTGTTTYDFSDNNFSILRGTITVISPNGGETWVKGTSHSVTWTDNICENVRIELWKGTAFSLLIANSVPSNGFFNWIVPDLASMVPGNDYKIKVMSTVIAPNTTTSVFDFSDAFFSITQGNYLTVTVPNGGETWVRGTTHFITWIDNNPDNVRIELWKSGVFSMMINPSAPGTGSCPWAIPATLAPGNNYKVKIISLSASVPLFDFSDNNFSITAGQDKSVAEETVSERIVIFPNPCGDRLKIKLRNGDPFPVAAEIMSLTGKLVLQKEFAEVPPTGEIEINTSGFADGRYIFVLRENNEIVFRNALIIRH